jgi:hypothetical protein
MKRSAILLTYSILSLGLVPGTDIITSWSLKLIISGLPSLLPRINGVPILVLLDSPPVLATDKVVELATSLRYPMPGILMCLHPNKRPVRNGHPR